MKRWSLALVALALGGCPGTVPEGALSDGSLGDWGLYFRDGGPTPGTDAPLADGRPPRGDAARADGTGRADGAGRDAPSPLVDGRPAADRALGDAGCACVIGGKCFAPGEADPTNTCNRCDPARSVVLWTASAVPGCVLTLAGTGGPGSNDGAAAGASFNMPTAVAVDASGAVLVADWGNHRVRRVAGGQVTIFAGTSQGYADGASTSAAKLNWPWGVDVDDAGDVYVGDSTNHRVRVTRAGTTSTLAGSGAPGFLDEAWGQAQFNYPRGLAVWRNAGKVELFVADAINHRVRRVAWDATIISYRVTTYAGSGVRGLANGPGASAQFDAPTDVAVATDGTVYVADTGNHLIRSIAPGGATATWAGVGPGFADGDALTQTRFSSPTGVAIKRGAGSSLELVIADQGNNRVRRAQLDTGTQRYRVSTVAGGSVAGSADGPVAQARFAAPTGVAIDANGRIVVADRDNHRIRLVVP